MASLVIWNHDNNGHEREQAIPLNSHNHQDERDYNSFAPPPYCDEGGVTTMALSSINMGKNEHPLSSPATTTVPQKQGTFSPFVAFCFTINYILGTGFLTIPWAFVQGGLLLSSVIALLVGILVDMAKNYLLETMARAQVMLDDQLQFVQHNINDENDNDCNDIDDDQQNAQDPNHQDQDKHHPNTTTTKAGGYLVKDRKFEVNTLCRLFLGSWGMHLYTTSVCMYVFFALWAFTCVFSSAMAKMAPILYYDADAQQPEQETNDDANYLIYALLYACIVVPLTCLELKEQVVVQVVLTGARVLMLLLMLATSHWCSNAHEQQLLNNNDSTNNVHWSPAPLVRLDGIRTMLPIMVFAHIFQHGIPDLAHPVTNKRQLAPIFRSTCVFTSTAYIAIGCIVGAAFGQAIEQSSNLNWNDFAATANTGSTWTTTAISYYIVCFPALDVISAFPLNAITLGNNMFGAFYGEHFYKVQHNRWIQTRFRLLASIPPIVFAIWERKLGTITDYAGTTGFIMGFSFPALLYIRSRILARQYHYKETTYYSSYASSFVVAWCLFAFGLSMVLYVLFCLITKQ